MPRETLSRFLEDKQLVRVMVDRLLREWTDTPEIVLTDEDYKNLERLKQKENNKRRVVWFEAISGIISLAIDGNIISGTNAIQKIKEELDSVIKEVKELNREKMPISTELVQRGDALLRLVEEIVG